MIFGSTEKLKCEYSAELISALAHVILIAGDRVGFIFFNNDNAVIKILHSVKPEQDDLKCSGVRYVVETNSGWAKDNNIKVNSLLKKASRKEMIINSILGKK